MLTLPLLQVVRKQGLLTNDLQKSNVQRRDSPLHIPSIFGNVIRILSSSCGAPTALYIPCSPTAKTKFSFSLRRQSVARNIFLSGIQRLDKRREKDTVPDTHRFTHDQT